jgi:outer membrane protein OmpA-like peptidoglycan-associated protein
LTPASQGQLHNLAAIMKAYPRVNLKIGGFTDNVGDPVENKRLSEDRAASTMNALVAMGIPQIRVSAEGFGEERPISDNTTEAGRDRNRRVAINVMRK